jgi:hypothetical protein
VSLIHRRKCENFASGTSYEEVLPGWLCGFIAESEAFFEENSTPEEGNDGNNLY